MGIGGGAIGAVLACALAIGATSAAGAQSVDPNRWQVDETNEYWGPPELARNLRCAAMFDVITDKYFKSPEGPSPKWRGRIGYGYLGWGEVRMPPEDERERDSYNAVGKVFAERAWALAEQAEDGPVRRYSDARDNAVSNGQRFLKAGKLWEALNGPLARCMEEPAARAVADRLRARLAMPTPDNRQPTSPLLKAGWLPSPMFGYLYQANSYRYLVCSAVAQAIGELRFGHIPDPFDGPLSPNWDQERGKSRLSPGDAVLRRQYARATFDTFDAGKVFVKPNVYKEMLSYRASQGTARADLQKKLPERALLEEVMKEPGLRCAELPTMAPIFGGRSGGTSADPVAAAVVADDVIPVSEIPGWPERRTGYLLRSASFRPLFCGALVYKAYFRDAAQAAWFAPPSNKSMVWDRAYKESQPYDPAEQGEREAVKRAIYALYDAAQIDEKAKRTANDPRSEFAENFEKLMFDAGQIIAEGHGVLAFNEPSARCGELPELRPVAQAALSRLTRLDNGQLRLR